MLNGKPRETHDIEATASRWAVRSAEGKLTAAEQRALDEWLERDARHLGAFVRAQAVWADIDRVSALQAGARAAPTARRSRIWRPLALAASLAIAIITGAFMYDRLPGRIATERGEVRRIVLEDGSTVFLNGDSVLQVRFGGKKRSIILRRGEASFQVAHDETRPFVVDAEDVTVTAVGTEFSVGLADDDVAVTVAEGVVKVRRPAARKNEEHQYLRRNEKFIVASTGPRRTQLEPSEVHRELAWREGLLVFEGQPLGLAAKEVNRHADMPVLIDDPTLARAEFIGVFHIGDSQSFADAAAFAFNGEVIKRDGALHLVRKQYSRSH